MKKNLIDILFENEEKKEETGSSSGEFNDIVKNATKLGAVDVEKAKGLIQLKKADPADSIKVNSSQQSLGSCKTLLPSQSSMNLQIATGFALGMLNGTMWGSGGPGGDLGAFSCGGYLLDGHHRWIATCMVAPGESVNGYEITGIDPVDAVKVLNVATAAFMGHNKGKTGSGSFSVFKEPDKILEMLVLLDEKAPSKNGIPNVTTPGSATKICEGWAEKEGNGEKGEEALKWAANKMAENCSSCAGVDNSKVLIPSNVRADMPVADDPETAVDHQGDIEPGFTEKGPATTNLIDALNSGGLDVRESIDIKRWHKLAGLLKD